MKELELGRFKVNDKYNYLIAAIAIILFPFMIRNNYVLHISIVLGIYLILGVSLNIVTGVAGELDLGHAAFFGIGAYVSSLFAQNIFNNFWIGLLSAALISLVFGFILGIPSLRIRGDYLAIVTLGFNEIVRYVLLNWQSVTNGPMGIHSIKTPSIFGYSFNTKQALFYLIYALVLVTIILMSRISKSRFGRALVGIRENEIAALSMGINTGYYKIWAFAITAAFAGVAGSLFAHYMSFISPMNFTSNESILILCMVVLGGKGSLIGSIVGVSVLLLLPEILRSVSMYRMLIYGMVLIFMMVYRPNGFWPEKRIPRKI
ncbi:MAG: hypothetical protein APF77_07045 [Clostridia bacterium BRH_c25]|nr:MAG: hypothetical protein APF77_07045 [Clostridia bacterium BRH_c25]